jgi:hypothetical protein
VILYLHTFTLVLYNSIVFVFLVDISVLALIELFLKPLFVSLLFIGDLLQCGYLPLLHFNRILQGSNGLILLTVLFLQTTDALLLLFDFLIMNLTLLIEFLQ